VQVPHLEQFQGHKQHTHQLEPAPPLVVQKIEGVEGVARVEAPVLEGYLAVALTSTSVFGLDPRRPNKTMEWKLCEDVSEMIRQLAELHAQASHQEVLQ
jgi:hypothetical protein